MIADQEWGIAFDWDGTLMQARRADGIERFGKLASHFGLPFGIEIKEKVKLLWGRPAEELIGECWPHADVHAFKSLWSHLDLADPRPLISGVTQMLAALHPNFSLVVITARDRSIHPLLHHFRLDGLFEFILHADNCPIKKPHPGCENTLIERFDKIGVRKEHIILVGDSIEGDTVVALRAGFTFFGVTWGWNTREDFINIGIPDADICDSVPELIKALYMKVAGIKPR